MNQNLTLVAKIAGRSMLAWLKVAIPGILFSTICFVISLVLLRNNAETYLGDGSNSVGELLIRCLAFILSEFWTAVLLLTAVGGIFFYIIFANKLALQTAIYQTWKQKASDWIMNKFEAYLDKLNQRKISSKKPLNNAKDVKVEMLSMIKEDSTTSSLQKRVMRFILSKLYLDDVNFSDPELKLNTVIRTAVAGKLADTLEPSLMWFWIVFAAQIIIMVLAVVYDHH